MIDHNLNKFFQKEGEKDLHEIIYSSDLSLNSICPIMQTDLENGMTVIQLECKHCFIPEAINKWLKEEKAECPVCRFALDSKEIKDNSIENERYDRYDRYDTYNINNTNLFPLLRYSYEGSYLFNILNSPSQQRPSYI